MSDSGEVGDTQGTYQYCCEILLHNFHFAVAAYHGLPYLVAWRCLVFFDHDEQRAVPSCHAIGLFISEDEVLEVFFFIPPIVFLVCQQLLVVFATSIGMRSYMQL
jgi:hypothetical protein